MIFLGSYRAASSYSFCPICVYRVLCMEEAFMETLEKIILCEDTMVVSTGVNWKMAPL